MIDIAESKKISTFMPSITYLGPEPLYEMQHIQDPRLPVNYNPGKIGTRQVFDYSNFKLSGELIDTENKTELNDDIVIEGGYLTDITDNNKQYIMLCNGHESFIIQ